MVHKILIQFQSRADNAVERSSDVQKRSHSSGDHQKIQVLPLDQSINRQMVNWQVVR